MLLSIEAPRDAFLRYAQVIALAELRTQVPFLHSIPPNGIAHRGKHLEMKSHFMTGTDTFENIFGLIFVADPDTVLLQLMRGGIAERDDFGGVNLHVIADTDTDKSCSASVKLDKSPCCKRSPVKGVGKKMTNM